MQRRSHFRRRAFLYAGLALACVHAPALAGFNASVTGTATRESSGLYLYTYTVSVSATSTVSATEFDVTVNDPSGLASITAWGDFFTFYNAGDPFISFTAFDAGIIPGASGIFSFESMSLPSMVPYLVRGLDNSSFATDDIPGLIVGPGVVPEPSSLLLCAFGGVGVGLLARARRWRSSGRGRTHGLGR